MLRREREPGAALFEVARAELEARLQAAREAEIEGIGEVGQRVLEEGHG
jgi:hypothetical protein